MNTWENPLNSDEERYQIAVGAIYHRDDIIHNLRQQIEALRNLAIAQSTIEAVDAVQFAHIRQAVEARKPPAKEPNKQCSNWLRENGQPYSRTCKVCGIFSKCENEQ